MALRIVQSSFSAFAQRFAEIQRKFSWLTSKHTRVVFYNKCFIQNLANVGSALSSLLFDFGPDLFYPKTHRSCRFRNFNPYGHVWVYRLFGHTPQGSSPSGYVYKFVGETRFGWVYGLGRTAGNAAPHHNSAHKYPHSTQPYTAPRFRI